MHVLRLRTTGMKLLCIREDVCAHEEQIRVHNTVRSDLYLDIRSRPIIENCSELGFAPRHQAKCKTAEEQPGQEGSALWKEVQDFQWVRAGQSPNWHVIEVEQRRREQR